VSEYHRFQLSALNPNINALCSNLVVGETLCLGLEGQDCTATYIVQPDDTCDEIRKANGVDATVFFANNPQINENCLNLYIDEVSLFSFLLRRLRCLNPRVTLGCVRLQGDTGPGQGLEPFPRAGAKP
jgi:hypothetical protein